MSSTEPLRWIVYYQDGSTFSSEDGSPEKAPRDYVQVVMQDEPFRHADRRHHRIVPF